VEATTEASSRILWVKALRAPFIVASLIPLGIGASLALLHLGTLNSFLLLLTVVGGSALHISTNMLNDFFDFKSGNDLAVDHRNPFAGGGRVLPTGMISHRSHFAVALSFLAVGSLIGMYLFLLRGLLLLLIGLVGIFSLFFYVGPPLKLAHHGVGEFIVGLNFGPVIVLGTYLVQTGRIDPVAGLASIPVGLLVTAILWVNEFPDVEADLAVGKRTLMARLGRRASVRVYIGILAAAYIVLVIAVLLGFLPPAALASLLSLPIAVKAARHLRAHYEDPHAMIPANALTILLLLVFGGLQIGALIASALLWTGG
jgi:1,4-dihydroxy-2-naphthoate octaprenyltransferase